MITLERSRPFGYIIRHADGRTVLVQSDWDYPGVASSFGWSIASVRPTLAHAPADCAHDGSDGTVGCEVCGLTPFDFIGAAADWLDEHDGATADDPGYFLED